MQNPTLIQALALVLAASNAACSADTEPNSTLGPEDLPDTYSGAVFDEDTEAVPGVEICVYERDDIPCVTTDDDGQHDIRLPHDEDIILSYDKDGFMPKLRMYRSPGDHFGFWAFQRYGYYQQQADAAGLELDEDAAIVTVEPGREGLAVAISPQSGEGPFYFDNELNVDPDATVTGEWGVGAYVNVEPGTYHADASGVTGSTITCEAVAWSGTDGAAEVLAVAGHVSWTALECQR